jgi:uncharacterized membrane protein
MLRRRAILAVKAIGIAGILLAPLAIHAAVASATWTPLIVVIPVLQLLIIGIIMGVRDPARIKWLVGGTAVLALALVWGLKSGLGLAAIPGIPHALAYSALLVGFGVSLRPGREAILTRVVAAVRGPLPPEIVIHTRRVTWAWCCFFAAQLVASATLFFLAPVEVWSFFINVLNLPLVLLMFGLECGYRHFRYRDFPPDSLSDILRAVAKTTEKHPRPAGPAQVLVPFCPPISAYDDRLPADPP